MLDEAGLLAIQTLRKTKLELELPFMINTSLLPPDQCYYEYTDGSLQLVTISRITRDFVKVRELSEEEQALIRKTLRLERLAAK